MFTIVIFLFGGVLRILMYMNLLFMVWAKEGMMEDKWFSEAPVTDVDHREQWPLILISELLYPPLSLPSVLSVYDQSVNFYN